MKWENPAPYESRQAGKWGETSRQLRAHPERWALIKEDPESKPGPIRGLASRIRSGLGADETWKPAGAFEATIRTEDGKIKLYVRFVGHIL